MKDAIKDVKEPSYDVRRRAIAELAQFKEPSAVAALVQAIDNENSFTTPPTVPRPGPGACGNDEYFQQGNRRAQAVERLQAQAIHSLVKIGPLASLALVSGLAHKDRNIRRQFILAQKEAKTSEALEALLKNGMDKDVYLSNAACHSLVAFEDSSVTLFFLKTLQEPRPLGACLGTAIEEVVRRHPPEATQVFIKIAKATNLGLEKQAARALGRLGSKEGVPTLLRIRRSKDRFLREIAVESLGRIGGDDAKKAVLQSLKDEDVAVRIRSLRALRAIGDKSSVPAIQSLANDPEKVIRDNVGWTLAEIAKKP